MRQKLLAFLCLSLFAFSSAFAQTKTISGRVTGSDDGLPLPGVSVKVKGTNAGTQTNADGAFTLSAPASATTLVFTYLGYTTKEVAIGSQSRVDVVLASDAQQLSEVVVTGYGTQAKREVGGSIAKVTGAQFENQPIASFEKALQGRAAGVQVASSNGIPGGAVNVQIRGSNSFLGGTQPLYIVDGVQLNGATFGGYTQTNTLAGINPNDIESIEVLKDAASAAIYGAQAGNGVVIITTKKGKAGKTNFKFNYYTGAVNAIKEYDVLSTQEYFNMRMEARMNQNPRATVASLRALQLQELNQPTTLTDAEIANLPTYDWQDAAFRTGKVSNYELSASGGNEKTTFYTSGSYNKQEAQLMKNDFQRANFKATLDHKATDRLTINANINLTNLNQKTPTLGVSGSSLGNPAFSAPLMIPGMPIYNADGTYNRTLPGILNQNIVMVNDYNSGDQRTNQAIGTVGASYKILPDLTLRTTGSVEFATLVGKSYRDPRTPDGATFNGLGQVFNNTRSNIQTNAILSYTKAINEDHKVDVLGGFEFRYDQSRTLEAAGTNYPSFLFRNISAAGTPFSVNESWTGYKMLSYLARVQYNFQDKYIVSGNFRYTGSSRFGTDKQFGFFPGVTFAWNMNRENFLNDVSWINDLKLRASYGQTGRDSGIGNFSARALYSQSGVYSGVSGIAPAGLANPALRWERVTGLDLGLDFGLFKNRVTGTVGVYQTVNSDLLLNQPLSSTSGYTSIATNVGEIKSKGVEVELTTRNLDTKGGFKWSTSFNFSYTTNEITELYGGLDVLPADPATRVGYPNGAVFTFQYAGVNPATGRPMFYDVNNNLTYLPTAPDRKFIGTTVVPYFGGLTNNFSYKGFDADIHFQYQYGQLLQDAQEQFMREIGNRQLNAYRDVYERRWTTPGQITDIPRAYVGNTEPQGISRLAGSNLSLRTDYIRLRTAQVGYTVPASLLNKAKIANLRIYAQGTNLWTSTKFAGYDPEFSGTSLGIIPNAKNYTFGIQLGF